jgi:hypothetical protein
MMRHLIHRLGLLALAAVVILPGCDRSIPERAGRATPLETAAAPKTPEIASTEAHRPVLTGSKRHPKEERAWVTAEFEDPDPSVRLQAIEAWAREPGETLDPLTYALVDPDETVRTRAQELLEEELAQR